MKERSIVQRLLPRGRAGRQPPSAISGGATTEGDQITRIALKPLNDGIGCCPVREPPRREGDRQATGAKTEERLSAARRMNR